MNQRKITSLAFFAMLGLFGTAFAGKCRMVGSAAHDGCALPLELGNFQGFYECNPAVGVGRPENLEEASKIVEAYDRVKAVGVGHSWWQEQFCSGDDENAVNLVMTELKSTLDFIENPVNPSTFNGQEPPEDFPIKVDEDKVVELTRRTRDMGKRAES